jgi:hypothetical protein
MLLNKVLYEELESLYGIGSRIEISSINVLSRKNETIISYKIFYTNEEYFTESMEIGANFLLETSWSMMGYPDTKLIFVTSYENG